MELSENLKRIRKDNNLSQEQLAEKIGVSRQAVSKWESGQSYPEMDKMLMICKMFNYNIDELLTGNVKDVEEEKQSKINYNKYIEDFFSYITKTINCISSMTFKQKIGCLFEQFIIVMCIVFISLLIGTLCLSIFYPIIDSFGYLNNSLIFNIIYCIFKSIYLLGVTLLGILIVLHTFKIRYLDYFVEYTENESKTEDIENSTVKNKSNNSTEKETRTIFGKKQKIIFRDPEGSGSKFLSILVKVILFGLKCFIAFVAFWFILSFGFFAACLALSFMIVKSGILFAGIFLGLIALLTINFLALQLMFNFIVNKKNKKEKMGIAFISSILLGGIASGLVIIGITNFNFIEDNNQLTKSQEFVIPMKENLIIDNFNYGNNPDTYIEEDRADIKVVINHSEFTIAQEYENPTNRIHFTCYTEGNQNMKLIRQYISDVSNKEIKDYSSYTVEIYASKENIEKLKNNYQAQEVLTTSINELNDKIKELSNQNDALNEELKNKDSQINELEQSLNNNVNKENNTISLEENVTVNQ